MGRLGFRVDGEEVASAVEDVEGFWKRLLMSNFLTDEASDKGVVDLVEFVAVTDICAELDAEVDTDDTDVDDVDIGIGNTDGLDDIEDLPLTWPDDDVVGAVAGRLPNETTVSEDFATGAGNCEAEVVTVGLSSMDPKVTSVHSMSEFKQRRVE